MVDVEQALNSSATGQHLLLGSLVIPKSDSDPTGETRGIEDGLMKFWVDGPRVKVAIFSRDIGEWTELGGNDPIGTIKGYVGRAEDIPEGWFLCDGTNGTYDLTGYFILGSALEDISEVSAGTSTTISDHLTTVGTPSSLQAGVQSGSGVQPAGSAHTHSVTVNAHAITSDYSPPSFKLAFIQRVS